MSEHSGNGTTLVSGYAVASAQPPKPHNKTAPLAPEPESEMSRGFVSSGVGGNGGYLSAETVVALRRTPASAR